VGTADFQVLTGMSSMYVSAPDLLQSLTTIQNSYMQCISTFLWQQFVTPYENAHRQISRIRSEKEM